MHGPGLAWPCCREFEKKLKAGERKVYALTKERDALKWVWGAQGAGQGVGQGAGQG